MPTLESHTPCHLLLLGGSYPDVIPDPGAGGGRETEFTSLGFYAKKMFAFFYLDDHADTVFICLPTG